MNLALTQPLASEDIDLSSLLGFDGAEAVIEAWCTGAAPDPRETVWEWADRDGNVILPAISAAEAGAYDSSRTPYLREILSNLPP
ncbi:MULTISPECIES: hypothetical protein [Methylobacterium]|uniref:Uncharacterized protein n=1 Tax=Methylobacterium marchantiae TaxID=600331 RepID=A0ABW3WV16_9HYPH|nr:hypothetical protein [Methylobacterium sp. Leaf100]KQP18526.1 hypothetical protein ASF25_11785 [Methylobacterium sp. Leaf100]GJE17251.1 hypothetical protein AIGOOFII_1964 [Methylobacterium marchantiae]